MYDSGEQKRPRASIVIPLLTQVDEWLKHAVLSALNQTVPCEVLVITSPSTPSSNLAILAVLQDEYADLRVICRDPGMIFPAALNLGIHSSTADRIGFLMSDDWLEPDAVEVCLRDTSDIVTTSRTFYGPDGTTVLSELVIHHTPEAYQALHKAVDQASFIEHFLLLKREILDRVGGVDETLGISPGVDDFDMIWCMLEQGASVGVVGKELYNYRDHEGVRLTRHKRDDMLATFTRILDKHKLAGSERARVLQEHTPWFGLSMWSQYQKVSLSPDPGPAVRRLQGIYRAILPLRIRLSLHERLFSRWRRE